MKRVVTNKPGVTTVEFTREDKAAFAGAFIGTFILECDPRYDIVSELLGIIGVRT